MTSWTGAITKQHQKTEAEYDAWKSLKLQKDFLDGEEKHSHIKVQNENTVRAKPEANIIQGNPRQIRKNMKK